MFTNNKLSKAVRLAVAFGAASTAAFTGSVYAQEAEEAKGVERIEVTGSRLQRTDIEGALPVTVISREELSVSGDISVSDYLRDTNFNSFGSYQSTSGSSFGGASTVSLRGLGQGRTLILIDGRRAPTSPLTGSGQDLNSIPMAAVERIEILSDGASAVYGSDAIGGVINVITRKDFEGAEFTYGVGRPTQDGGDTEEMSFVIGTATDKSRMLFGASMNDRDVIFTRDRDYWYQSPGLSTYSNNFGVKQPSGHLTQLGASNRLKHPTNGAAVPGLCTNGDQSDLFYTTTAANGDISCQFDHAATSANLTALKNTSLFGRSNYQINDDWSLYFNGDMTKVKSFGRFAALPSSPWVGGAISLLPGTPNHPGTAPEDGGLNPFYDSYYASFADQELSLYHRFAALGPRDNTVENTTLSFSGGFEGTIGEVTLDMGARYVEGRALNLGQNYVVGGLAQRPITSGAYNIYDPFSGNPSSLGMTATTNRDMFSVVKELYANASFDVFDLPAGTVAAAVGAEYREERFQDKYDLLSAAGQVAGSSGASSGGSRDLTSLFGEMLFPVLETLDVEVAGRFDKYSDYGSDFSPKVAARWKPIDDLLIRASYGEGFRAPTLSNLTSEPAFGAAFTNDPATCIALTGAACTSPVQITTYSMGNVNLKSEQSKQYSLGIVWNTTEWLNMSVDYYNIEIDGAISTTTLATVVDCLRGTESVCPPGLVQFPNGTPIPNQSLGLGAMFEGNNVNGAITGAQLGSVNLGVVNTSGYDFTAQTKFDLGWGRLNNHFSISYVDEYSANNGPNAVGDDGFPELRASLNNGLAVGDFDLNWNLSMIDSMDDVIGTTAYHIPSWVTHNIQVTYNTAWDAKIAFGVNNLTDKDPADAALFSTGYNSELYSPWGRVPYVRYTQRF